MTCVWYLLRVYVTRFTSLSLSFPMYDSKVNMSSILISLSFLVNDPRP